ncbi:Spherulin-1A [Colletotrichum tropicale]|nr:Spherulin-1A [Colletotrichum tropicale]
MLSMFLCILRLLAEFATVHKIARYYDADQDRYRLVSLRVAGSAGAIVTIASNAPRGSAEAAVAATAWFIMRARPRLSVTGAQAEDASCDTYKIIDTTRALGPLPCRLVLVRQRTNGLDGIFRIELVAFLVALTLFTSSNMIAASMSPKTVFFIILGLLVASAIATDEVLYPDVVKSLKSSPTELDKLKILPDDKDWTFNYFSHAFHTNSPGGVVNANAASFPATVGNGMTMAWISLGPCAMLPPHYHARASNYVVSVEGTTETYMTLENGARVVKTLLEPGMMTLFPQGSLHTMSNTGCGNATLISALSSEDAGTHNVANGLFDLPQSVVAAAFGGNPLSAKFVQLRRDIPAVGTGASIGSAECLKRCEAQGSK